MSKYTEWVINDAADNVTTSREQTDYVFPDDWGLRTAEQKDRWFKQERTYRRAMRQDTRIGQHLRDHHSDSEYRIS